MTTEEQKFYEEALAMFRTVGWKNFVKEVELAGAQISIDTCNTLEELHQAKGRLHILRQIAAYEDSVRNQMEATDDEEAA